MAVNDSFRAESDYDIQILVVFALAGVAGTGAGAVGLKKSAASELERAEFN